MPQTSSDTHQYTNTWQQRSVRLNSLHIKALLDELKHPVFLDSANSNIGKASVISGNPNKVFKGDNADQLSSLVLPTLDSPQNIKAVAFSCGYIGYLKYSLGESLIIGNTTRNEELTKPSSDYAIGLYTWSLVGCNNHYLLTFSPLCTEEQRNAINSLVEKILFEQKRNHDTNPLQDIENEYRSIKWSKNIGQSEYLDKLATIHTYILEGDIYQANFTQRFEARSNMPALDIYFHLRELTETPFSAFMSIAEQNTDEDSLLSFSPERFIQIQNRVIKTSPIKGTSTNDGDETRSRDLLKSTKDRAENLMIVDLLRNDLSKVCKPHSVRVDDLFSLQTFNNVHHLVSNISGELADDINELTAFLSCFPGGSITGAPKKRAMEIIKETENTPRDAYCGSAFYWNIDGNFDSNILIRTIVKKRDQLFCWAGGGITVESDGLAEYNESLQKVANITGILPEQS